MTSRMMTAAQHIRSKAERIAAFLTTQRHKLQAPRPMFVSMQGPQGCGKSSLAADLVDVLHGKQFKTAVSSLDDFYLPHAKLKDLAARHASNALLQGRGPPGTHDLDELWFVLQALRDGPPPSQTHPVELPTFDKSLHQGEGDRSGSIQLTDPLDIFILEGWSLGYGPLPEAEAKAHWASATVASRHPFSSLQTLNTHLAEVEGRVGEMFDCHVCITPIDFAYVYAWRLEQEHKMKAANGGRGMTDAEVEKFVDRYMPVYEVFSSVRPDRETLTLVFNREREVVETQ